MAQRTEIVEVELPGGGVIAAEVALAGGGDVAAWERLRLEEATGTIRQVSGWVIDSVREALPNPPDRWGVEFGLKLAVKTGKLTSVLAEAGGEASVVVRLEWDRDARVGQATDHS